MSQRKRQAPSLPGLPTYSSSGSSSSSSDSKPDDYNSNFNERAGRTQEVESAQEADVEPGVLQYIYPPGSPTEVDTDEPELDEDESDHVDWDSEGESHENDGKEEENDGQEHENPIEAQNSIIVAENPVERILTTPSWADSLSSIPSAASSPLGPRSPTPPPPSPGPPANKPKKRGMPEGTAPSPGHQDAATGMDEDGGPDPEIAALVNKRKRTEKSKPKPPPRKKQRQASPEEEEEEDDDDESSGLSDPPSNLSSPAVVKTAKTKGKQLTKTKANKTPSTTKGPPNTMKSGKMNKGEETEIAHCSGRTKKRTPCGNKKRVRRGQTYNCGKH
ncbi:hypothetical protein BKA58DRAFT_461532 [Alternaria rosae]|uniref:uncharacterized protein n=1 Tax=Alternaria rosae TaxID=1187941 RepID=UPI001E8CB7DF|nr:uncharacterized protein BKA58DRAFT_461532 [Alternaria rosae]KAH6865638.1 hypothetical protein BKA58DRAFT_461532 [Alternaria rosae]